MKRIVIIALFLLFFLTPNIHGQEAYPDSQPASFQARVVKIVDQKEIVFDLKKQKYQKIELEITNTTKKGDIIIVEHGNLPIANSPEYRIGDVVVVTAIGGVNSQQYVISDYVRLPGLRNLFILFVIVTIVVARGRGVRSLIGMALSFLIVYFGFVSAIYNGANPVLTVIVGSLIIIPTNFYLSHGINKKTTIAIIATCITLFIALLLSIVSIDGVKLTGFASEDASFVSIMISGMSANMQGVLLASMFIGLLGILDDITISQAAIVEELHMANAKLTSKELYKKAMNVGKDHIASMVNTLILVYTGASLPLLLLFYNNPHPIGEILNYEIIADEVVRTLVGSISLMLAVPITTYIASLSMVHFFSASSIVKSGYRKHKDTLV